ncbi:putative transcription factor B3-Domain family [Helianthus annuus]|nr:putative transcription factor B3-Domain family [Helianthus annuus]
MEDAKNLFDTNGNSKVVSGDETVSPKGKSKLDMDFDNIAYRTRSDIHNKNECVDIDMMKPAENISRLPVDVSCDLCLSVDNLRDVSIKNLRRELIDMKTRAEKSGDGYRYGFTKWSSFLKSNHIWFGATLFFKYVKSSQLLMLTKVVHKTTKKRGRA